MLWLQKCAEGAYKLNKTCKETETRTSEPQKEDRTEVAISGLKPYTSYNITVFAVNCATDNNGEGEPDNINFVTNMSGTRDFIVFQLNTSSLKHCVYAGQHTSIDMFTRTRLRTHTHTIARDTHVKSY